MASVNISEWNAEVAKYIKMPSGEQTAVIVPETVEICRDFLKETYKLDHNMIVTNDIREEWKKHQSPYARKWYRNMVQRGRIKRHRGNIHNDDLRDKVRQLVTDDAVESVLKDIHLVEAALLVDKLIASSDDRMRRHLVRLATKIDELKIIVWVNPSNEAETCIIWLRQGAPAEESRQLGYEDEKSG